MKKALLIMMLFAATYAFADAQIETTYISWLEIKCDVYQVPSEIATAIAIVESNFTMITSTRNGNGSYDVGIFQLNSQYHEWFEETLWDGRVFDPYDPYDNIEMGIIYLRYLQNHTNDWDETVEAYNMGLNGRKLDPDNARNYLVKVINTLDKMRETK